MADWPTLAELKRPLGITSDEQGHSPSDDSLQACLSAAIEATLSYRGAVLDEGEEPTARMALACLHAAERYYKSLDVPLGISSLGDLGALYIARNDPIFIELMRGQRVSFGVA